MMERRHVRHVMPRDTSAKVTCFFLVVIPMVSVMTLTTLWVLHCKHMYESTVSKVSLVRDHTLTLGKLILDFNAEREATAIYITAPTDDLELSAKSDLDLARYQVDQSLRALQYWPGDETGSDMYRSRSLFEAFLNSHRDNVQIGRYFWDEVQYYTNIMDELFGWLTRDVDLYYDHRLWRWLLAYTYLMGSINHVGAEQALCSVFSSIACFTHKETFYFANASFSGETAFRMYRQSFPVERLGDTDWRTKPHDQFFPELHLCRKEVIANVRYHPVPDTECGSPLINDTKLNDLSILTVTEYEGLTRDINNALNNSDQDAAMSLVVATIALASFTGYFILLHFIRCICIRCSNIRPRSPKGAPPPRDATDGVTWQSRDDYYDDEKLDDLSLNHRMITYTSPECRPLTPAATNMSPCLCRDDRTLVNCHTTIPPPPVNCHNSITVKVATV